MLLNIWRRVDTYGVISIVLFFTFFIGMLFWAFRLKKGYLEFDGRAAARRRRNR